MFEFLGAKRVCREDLRDSSPESDLTDDDNGNIASLEARLRERIAKSLAIEVVDSQPAVKRDAPTQTASRKRQQDDGSDDDDTKPASKESEYQDKTIEGDGTEEFEFRLFRSAAPTTKITLPDADDEAPLGDGSMVRRRPLTYYIAEPLTEEERRNLEFAAVSGDEVLQRARQRWWGMEMPWKVTHIGPASSKLRSGISTQVSLTLGETMDEDAKPKRKRPGKKRRIATRTKEREAKKKAEAADKSKMSKEEHLKEKKKRLNRQRKLKRRAKAQEGKAGAVAGNESSDDSDA